jgi:DNA-binding HxlR family transcriptional regulator
MLGKDYQGQDCAMARALEVIGERWTLLIIRDAFFGVRRFSDFQAHLDIPKAVLSDRLGGLVQDGILGRRPDPAHGGRHRYELTEAGRELWPVLSALLSWGSRHSATSGRVFRHTVCGTPLAQRGRCATCDVTPGPEDILMEPSPGGPGRRDDAVSVALRSPHRLLEPVQT